MTKEKLYEITIFIITKHWILIFGVCFVFLLGVPVALFFVLTAYFVKTLIDRIKKDKILKLHIENNDEITEEPFEGALLVGALGLCCTGNADFAGMQMKQSFLNYHISDWTSMCRITSNRQGLNSDLLVECLASKLIKTDLEENTKNDIIASIFSFLAIVEYDWNAERGRKPSEYLAELLHRPLFVKNSEKERTKNAYKLLGIQEDASLEKIKSTHRMLISMYHPDTLNALSEDQQKIASETFLRIQAAYENIVHSLG